MIDLMRNEFIKLIGKRRLLVVTLIIGVIIALFTYAQYREAERLMHRYGTSDWKTTLQQQTVEMTNRLNSDRISEERKTELQTRLTQMEYYLAHDINPSEPGAPTFMREVIENAMSLLIPLLIMVIAADIVSSEHGAGTIKLLLTRPVRRWKILGSKYFTLIFSISLILMIFGFLSYFISGIVFGFGGWAAPVFTGYQIIKGELDVSKLLLIPQWQYIFMEFGLAWFIAVVVGTLSFMLSVLIRTTAAGMGVMLALLISGTILSRMVSSWESAKYLFMVNLELANYLQGDYPPIDGMTLGFSMSVLALWGLAALVISFLVFTKRDIY